MAHRLVVALLVVLLAGCSGSTPAQTASPGPTATSASTPTPTPTPTPTEPTASPSDDLVVGGDRPVTLHVPSSYSAATPAPLLIMLHGYGSSGREHEDYFHLGSAADTRGVVYAQPDGTVDSDGRRHWNATDACCDFDGTGVDDSDYLSALVASIKATVNVDPKQVFFIGHSNGGFMSYRMACDHADLVAGIISLAGTTFAEPADCRPSEPVAILQIHGEADDTILYGGGRITGIGSSGDPMKPFPGALDTVNAWATYDGCSGAVADKPGAFDVDANIDGADGPAESTIKAATGCQGGGHVELWTIPEGGHAPDIAAEFADEALDFFLAHPKP